MLKNNIRIQISRLKVSIFWFKKVRMVKYKTSIDYYNSVMGIYHVTDNIWIYIFNIDNWAQLHLEIWQ